eukprot:5417201-Prymnesium_polylepis.1
MALIIPAGWILRMHMYVIVPSGHRSSINGVIFEYRIRGADPPAAPPCTNGPTKAHPPTQATEH